MSDNLVPTALPPEPGFVRNQNYFFVSEVVRDNSTTQGSSFNNVNFFLYHTGSNRPAENVYVEFSITGNATFIITGNPGGGNGHAGQPLVGRTDPIGRVFVFAFNTVAESVVITARVAGEPNINNSTRVTFI